MLLLQLRCGRAYNCNSCLLEGMIDSKDESYCANTSNLLIRVSHFCPVLFVQFAESRLKLSSRIANFPSASSRLLVCASCRVEIKVCSSVSCDRCNNFSFCRAVAFASCAICCLASSASVRLRSSNEGIRIGPSTRICKQLARSSSLVG